MLVLVEVLNHHILEHERVTITLTSPLNPRFQGSHAGHKVNVWLKVVIQHLCFGGQEFDIVMGRPMGLGGRGGCAEPP